MQPRGTERGRVLGWPGGVVRAEGGLRADLGSSRRLGSSEWPEEGGLGMRAPARGLREALGRPGAAVRG